MPELSIAIDGGTTNTRARLLQGSSLLSVGSRAVGVRDVAIGGSSEPLHRAIAQAVSEALRTAGIPMHDIALFCASGMLTSNVGLQEVPHVRAPAALDDLARHVVAVSFPEIAPKPVHLIPGIKTLPIHASLGNLAQLDILRGEECEVFGILQATGRAGPLCILLPGSHTKLLHIDQESRISASHSTIGGEMMQALAERTILASSMDWPPTGEPVWPAVEAGAQFARDWGIARGGFAVRLADVLAVADRAERTWFFVGLVVGNDWSELVRWSQCGEAIPLLVGGREPLRSVYGFLAKTVRRSAAEVLDESVTGIAAATGAIAIARRFKERSSHP
jgi:2-dehydro-3-deoxygalactonokinase